MARYMLQAKRPHEKFFTEWCQTDNYEVIERNIKIIESYGWEWRLNGDQERAEKEQTPIKQEKVKKEQDLKDQIRSELAREIFAELEFDIHQLMFERDETRAIAIEGIIASLKKKHTEGKD